jgi:hypothetical protein
MKNWVNCWEAYGFKRKFDAMVISSEAVKGLTERSTTRVSNLEQMKTPRAPDVLFTKR